MTDQAAPRDGGGSRIFSSPSVPTPETHADALEVSELSTGVDMFSPAANDSDLFSPGPDYKITVTYLSKEPREEVHYRPPSLRREYAEVVNRRMAEQGLGPLFGHTSDVHQDRLRGESSPGRLGGTLLGIFLGFRL